MTDTKDDYILKQSHVECEGCDVEDRDVRWYCLTCKASLCDKCKNAKMHRKHTVKPWQDPDAVENRQNTSISCEIHPLETYVTFCVSCQILCCTICFGESHSGHTFSTIDDTYSRKIQEMADTLKTLREHHLESTEKTIADLKEMIQKSQENHDDDENLNTIRESKRFPEIADDSSSLAFHLGQEKPFVFVASDFDLPDVKGCIGKFCRYNKEKVKPAVKPRTTLSDDKKVSKQDSPQDYELTRLMQNGEYSEVWNGTWKDSKHVTIWIKKLPTSDSEETTQEIDILRDCKHDNIVKLLGTLFQNGRLHIVTTYMAEGPLNLFLKGKTGSQLEFPVLMDFAYQIASGMSFLESTYIVHGDLGARNVYVGDSLNLRIGEFSMASRSSTHTSLRKRYPIKWTAPESAFQNKFTIKSDVWSYGILIVEILTYGQMPYPGVSNSELMGRIESGYRHPKPTNCPSALYVTILKCWNRKVEERPTFEFLSSFFEDYMVAFERQYDEIEED